MEEVLSVISRSDQKTQMVVKGIRNRILDGQCGPGDQLPTWGDLESDFGVGRTTVARALVQLKKEGFVYSDSTRGTFVSQRPPHTFRYGLVFPKRPGDMEWNRHWWMLANESTVVAREHDCQIICFYDIAGDVSESPDWAQLKAQVQSHRLAGLILIGASAYAEKVTQLTTDMPCVVISKPGNELHVPVITLNTQAFFDAAIEQLKTARAQRIGLLSAHTNLFELFTKSMDNNQMPVDPTIMHAASASDPLAAYHQMRMLGSLPPSIRPDGLIIADDNLIAHAYRGLLDVGIVLPREMKVITLCNWPLAHQDVLATGRIGFDCRDVLKRCLSCIDQWRSGEQVNPIQLVEPVAEENLPAMASHQSQS